MDSSFRYLDFQQENSEDFHAPARFYPVGIKK